MDMQDNPQTEAMAQDATSTQDPMANTGSSQATGDDQSSGQKTTDQLEAVDFKTHKKLQSDYQATVGRLQKTQQELTNYATRSQQYEQTQKALESRLMQLEQRLQPQAKQSNEPDFSTMDTRQIVQYLKEEAKKESVQEALKQFQELQTESQNKQAADQEEQWFAGRWQQLQQKDPSVDVKELEDYMRANKVYDPIAAYNNLHYEDLIKNAVAEAQKATVKKIATNQRNQTEGAGKAGIVPPPAEKKWSSKRERNSFIVEEYNRRQAAQPSY